MAGQREPSPRLLLPPTASRHGRCRDDVGDDDDRPLPAAAALDCLDSVDDDVDGGSLREVTPSIPVAAVFFPGDVDLIMRAELSFLSALCCC